MRFMELYYADQFYTRINLKINKQILFDRLEEYEEGSFVCVELSGEKFEIDEINGTILC